MMKKNALLLLFICVLTGEALYGQVVTNDRFLKQASVSFKIDYQSNYAKAMQLAREKNWPLSYRTRKGGLAVLGGVDQFNNPKYYVTYNNTIAAATTRANQLWPGGRSGLALSGSSANLKNKMGIWDGGSVLGSHVELTGKITQKDNPSTTENHSTHVAGTMVATGVNPAAKGMAFGSQGIVAYDFTNDVSEMTAEAANLLLSNHSYSFQAGWVYNSSQSRWEFHGEPGASEDFRFGYYGVEAQRLDEIAYNAPHYLIVKAAGNSRDENGPAVGESYYRRNAQGQFIVGTRPSGIYSNDAYDIIPWENVAKNILTVGAVHGIASGYSRKEDVVMSDFSCWGPTDDGRIKPDIVADGIGVVSPIASSNTGYAGLSGTSMAAPNATGSLLLLQEHYSKLKNSATAFMRSATLKGLAIHTADEAGNAIGPDYKFGWGLLNVEKAAEVMTAAITSTSATTSEHHLYENVLNQGQTFTFTVVASGKQPLKATLCWTDPKGTPVPDAEKLNSRTKMLVNDLDIRITRGAGASLRTYLPWTLDVNSPAADAMPGDNTIDNVERIDVDTATTPGVTYTITVSHKGTLQGGTSQAYSLLVSGTGGVAVCTSNPNSNTGARIETLSFKTINVTNPAGNTSYTDNTRLIADVEPAQASPISIKVGSSDASDQPKMLKVFIDFNNNGTFESNEQVAVSAAPLANNATFSGNITLPSTVTVGSIYTMRVVLQETSAAADISGCGSYGKGETQDYRIRVTSPSNDMTISSIISPVSLDCGTDSMYATIAIRNSGTIAQANIPVSLDIASSAGALVSMTATYPGAVPAMSAVNYTFQKAFTMVAGTAYTLTATVSLAADQFNGNDRLVTTVVTASKPSAPSAVASICSANLANLRINNPDLSNYYWYLSSTTNQPFASGSVATSTVVPSNNTFYVAKETRSIMGLPNKMVYASGGYNHFSGNFMRFNNTVPIMIESARFYVGNPGKVRITVGKMITENSDGSYSYNILSSTVLDMYATRPNPGPGEVPNNVAEDAGAVYRLGLPVALTGDHFINVVLLNPDGSQVTTANTGATLFRNNAITGTTYPVGINQVASFTGNSATGAGIQQSQFYYFFYDLKVNTGECVSDRIPVVATVAPTPAIQQQGNSLVVTNVTSGIQWYLNDVAINGAAGTSYNPTVNGAYKVVVIDAMGCQKTSNVINYVVTAIDPTVAAREIDLSVSPNPNNGVFNLSFEVTSKADLTIEILNAAGQKVFNNFQSGFVGKYSRQIQVQDLSSDVYMLRINHDKKNYVQKIIIQRK